MLARLDLVTLPLLILQLGKEMRPWALLQSKSVETRDHALPLLILSDTLTLRSLPYHFTKTCAFEKALKLVQSK